MRTASRHPVGRFILVIGGASSGKSDYALQLAGRARPRAFVATGQPLDDEMAQRIRRHQTSRSSEWETAEVPLDVVKWFEADADRYRAVVLDCITLWLSNLQGAGVAPGEIQALVHDFLTAMRTSQVRVIVVTNELGMGLVPCDPGTRAFRDLAGTVNRQLAAAADEVHLAVAGLALRLK